MKSAIGGTPRGSRGRGGSTASIACLGRGVTWPVRAAWDAVAGPPSDPLAAVSTAGAGGDRRWPSKSCSTNWTGWPRWATTRCGRDCMRLLGGRARATLLGPRPGRPREPAGRRRGLPRVPARGTRRLARARIRGRCASSNRSTTPRRWPGRPSPSRCSSPACISRATWPARRRSTPPGPPPAISPPRRPSPAASPAAARPWSAPPAKASARPPAGCSSASNPATPSSGPRWLAEWLERELLGDLLADLRRGAEVPQEPGLPGNRISPPCVRPAVTPRPTSLLLSHERARSGIVSP